MIYLNDHLIFGSIGIRRKFVKLQCESSSDKSYKRHLAVHDDLHTALSIRDCAHNGLLIVHCYFKCFRFLHL